MPGTSTSGGTKHAAATTGPATGRSSGPTRGERENGLPPHAPNKIPPISTNHSWLGKTRGLPQEHVPVLRWLGAVGVLIPNKSARPPRRAMLVCTHEPAPRPRHPRDADGRVVVVEGGRSVSLPWLLQLTRERSAPRLVDANHHIEPLAAPPLACVRDAEVQAPRGTGAGRDGKKIPSEKRLSCRWPLRCRHSDLQQKLQRSA